MKRTSTIIIVFALLMTFGCDKIAYLPKVTSEAKVNGTTVLLTMECDGGNESFAPQVEIDTDGNFQSSTTLVFMDNTDENKYELLLEGLQPYTKFYYRFVLSNSSDGRILVNEGDYFTTGATTVPTAGQLSGQFSVSDGQKVFFSQGNLQYLPSLDTWRFSPLQYFCMGEINQYISEGYSYWIDLFGWGTSGYSYGPQCYQPWSTSKTATDYGWNNSYFGYYDLVGNADWGYNRINNGGNMIDSWRTLSKDEWSYLLNSRNTASGILFAKAKVINVNSLVLLPDDWDPSVYAFQGANDRTSSFSRNKIDYAQLASLQNAGAVFLPTGGVRDGASPLYVGECGFYWSSSRDKQVSIDNSCAWGLGFDDTDVDCEAVALKWYGMSVRLVRPVSN